MSALSEVACATPDAPAAHILRLDRWVALRAQGADTESFLQGQLSADLRKLRPDCGLWAGYHSPKGRLLALPLALRDGESVELWLPADLAEPVLKRLRMFVMRSKVLISDSRSQVAALGVLGSDAGRWLEVRGLPVPDAALQQLAHQDLRVVRSQGIEPRYLVLGAPGRLAGLAPDARFDDRAWRLADIQAGVPAIHPETQDRWVAQMVNLDLLGGVSFDKGCYTGQEVVARLHYLGNLKKRMFLVRGAGTPPAPGSAIHDAEGDAQAVGEIVDAAADGAGYSASAVLQIARRGSATLRVDGTALSVPQAYPEFEREGHQGRSA